MTDGDRCDADWLVVHADAMAMSAAMARGHVTSVELVAACLRRIEHGDRVPGGTNAILVVAPEALADAAARDAERHAGGSRGPLHGVPVVVKDNLDTADLPTAAGSIALRDRRPLADAAQVAQLRAAGAVILGKTNMDELAAGFHGLSSNGGQIRNPYDPRRYPGGSSGGTAVAVTTGLAALGLGSDTGCSIRNPATHNGIAGLRTTHGLTSRAGVCPVSFTQDVVGPLARSVRDLAAVLDATALCGPDASDPATLDPARRVPSGSYLDALDPDGLRGRRIAVFRPFFDCPEDPAGSATVNAVIERALRDLATAGAELIELDGAADLLDAMDHAETLDFEFGRDVDAYLAGVPVATSSELDTLAGTTPPAGRLTVADLVASGSAVPLVQQHLSRRAAVAADPHYAANYAAALAARERQIDALTSLFAELRLDAVAYPSQQTPAALIGSEQHGYRPMNLSALSGWPALTIPAGLTADGMPAGLELLSAPYAEPELLAMGFAYEQRTRRRVPPAAYPALDHVTPA